MKKLSRQQWLFVAIALICFALLKAGLIYWYLQQKDKPAQPADISCSNLQQGCALPDGSTLRFDRVPPARPAPSFRWKKWTWASTATALSPQASSGRPR